jgi:hypothetical protein
VRISSLAEELRSKLLCAFRGGGSPAVLRSGGSPLTPRRNRDDQRCTISGFFAFRRPGHGGTILAGKTDLRIASSTTVAVPKRHFPGGSRVAESAAYFQGKAAVEKGRSVVGAVTDGALVRLHRIVMATASQSTTSPCFGARKLTSTSRGRSINPALCTAPLNLSRINAGFSRLGHHEPALDADASGLNRAGPWQP